MELIFLGTAAAEGWPGMFCRCESCQKARQLGSKNIRTRASIQIGTKYKFDLPPDSYHQMLIHNISYADLEHLFISHTHFDHFSLDELEFRQPAFAKFVQDRPLYIYGNEVVCKKIKELEYLDMNLANIILHLLTPFISIKAGELLVTPIKANHMQDKPETALNYIVQVNNKTILIGYDTGWYPEITWQHLNKFRLDIVILDCTGQKVYNNPRPDGHLGINGVLETKHEMDKLGIIDNNCTFIVSHFSHNGGMLHQEMEERMKPENIIVAYDGMRIKL